MPRKIFMKSCDACGQQLPISSFFQIEDFTFPDGYVPICKDCISKEIRNHDGSFDFIDRLLQWIGIPFIIDKWLELTETYKDSAFEVYVKMYKENKFPYIDWKSAYLHYKELEEDGVLEESILQFSTAELNRLRLKWGEEYTDEKELHQLEKLYQGITNTYSIFGEKQLDDVKKICKISLVIDQKIRDGEDFEKYIKSYDQLSKIANLTPKNIKDATDFSSAGELFAYLEKSGWLNEFYTGEEKDIVDSTMKNIQNWTRNLYVNESSIPEDIENRIAALQIADDMEDELNAIEDDGLDDEEFIDEEFLADIGG